MGHVDEKRAAEAALLREHFPRILESADRILERLRWSETGLELSSCAVVPVSAGHLPLGLLLECWRAGAMLVDGGERFGRVHVLGFGGTTSGTKEWRGVTADGRVVVGGVSYRRPNEWALERRDAIGAEVVPFEDGQFSGGIGQLRIGQAALWKRFVRRIDRPERGGGWEWPWLVGPQPLEWLVAQLDGEQPERELPPLRPEPLFRAAYWRDKGPADPLLGDGKLHLADHIHRDEALIAGFGELHETDEGPAWAGIACFPTWTDYLLWLRWAWLPAANRGLGWTRGRSPAFEGLKGGLESIGAWLDGLPHGARAEAAVQQSADRVPFASDHPRIERSRPVPVVEYMAARGSVDDWKRVTGCDDFDVCMFRGLRATSPEGWAAAAREIEIRARGSFLFDLRKRDRWGRPVG
jgi:hypothetical protein